MPDYDMPQPIERTAYVEITDKILCQRLDWLREFHERNGFVPNYRTVARGWQISHGAVGASLEKMAERGWIIKSGRNVVLTGDDPCHENPVQLGEGRRRLG